MGTIITPRYIQDRIADMTKPLGERGLVRIDAFRPPRYSGYFPAAAKNQK